MPLSRRQMIRNTALGTGIIAVGNVHSLFAGAPALAAPGTGLGSGGAYGSLLSDPAGLLDLPVGFTYRVISEVGETLPNGAPHGAG